MNSGTRYDRLAGPRRARLAWMSPILVMAGLAAGCSDHRISLAEFIHFQEEAAVPSPATQPAGSVDEARALIDRALGPYRIGPGDVLRIIITELQQGLGMAPLDARVDRSGEIDLAGIGAVRVGDMELEDAEDKLREAYLPLYRQASVHVALVEPDPADVLVVGAVTAPGLVKLRRSERNLLYAIAAAGGVSDLASGEVKLQRLRRPDDGIAFNLTDPEGLKAALVQEPLESGDILHVGAAAPNTVFVGGLVNNPNPQTYPQGVQLTILQAIAGASGLRDDVTPRDGTLIRRMADGRDLHVKLDLDRISSGRDPNIMLAAGDVLWVPHTVETRVQDWINKNIFFRAGVVSTANISYNATAVEFMNSKAEATQLNSRGGTLEDSFDPFGFLLQNQALQQRLTVPQAAP